MTDAENTPSNSSASRLRNRMRDISLHGVKLRCTYCARKIQKSIVTGKRTDEGHSWVCEECYQKMPERLKRFLQGKPCKEILEKMIEELDDSRWARPDPQNDEFGIKYWIKPKSDDSNAQ